MSDRPSPGTIAWRDLTVDDAQGVRDFYTSVVGWEPSPVDMGGEVLVEPREMGTDRYCVIRDPAGAVCALYQKGE